VSGGALADEAERGGIIVVAVVVHLVMVMVTVTVLTVVSGRHEGQLSASCGVRGEVSYHDVPEHG
jgi:hypothetical protein